LEELQTTLDFAKSQYEQKISRLQENISESERRTSRNPETVSSPRSDRMLLHRSNDTFSGVSSGDVPFVVLDRVQQALHVREEEVTSLRIQLDEACTGRQA